MTPEKSSRRLGQEKELRIRKEKRRLQAYEYLVGCGLTIDQIYTMEKSYPKDQLAKSVNNYAEKIRTTRDISDQRTITVAFYEEHPRILQLLEKL